MPIRKPPKTIATINFKGGVGKTTTTWCLADVVSAFSDLKVLVFDLDAQMSLTQAVMVNDETGNLQPRFQQWYSRALAEKQTIYHALDNLTSAGDFDFTVGQDFVFEVRENLHFVPSVLDLYWFDLKAFDHDKCKDFIRRLLAKIAACPHLPAYDFVLFDCPPSFTVLSYSVLACADLLLIPVNPDFFAAEGTGIILKSLRGRIEPFPFPKIGVFMNKAKPHGGDPTLETQAYMRKVWQTCRRVSEQDGIHAKFFEAWIPELAAIKRVFKNGGVPEEVVAHFKSLWLEAMDQIL